MLGAGGFMVACNCNLSTVVTIAVEIASASPSDRGYRARRSGPSTNWLKAKCYSVAEYELLRVSARRQACLRADRRQEDGEYVGSAFINSSRAIRERITVRCLLAFGRLREPLHHWL
jgi:hypothetical protein